MTATLKPSAAAADAAALFPADSALVAGVRPSPNHGERRGAHAGDRGPDMVLLHYTGMPAGRGLSACERATRWLTMAQSQVSCHYVVDEDGGILQLVAEERRAWHAGVACWQGETDINSASIGIEIVNPGHPWDLAASPDRAPGEPAPVHPGYADFPEAQIAAVIALVADIVARRGIDPKRVLAHSDVAPGRKTDPGEKFPWPVLAEAGLGLWVAPEPIGGGRFLQRGDAGQPVEALQSLLALAGYHQPITGQFDQPMCDVVTAFQRHYRPARVDGIADQSTIATLHRLLVAAGTRGGPAR